MIAPVDPYALFSRTQAYWVSQHYPARLLYTVVVRVTEAGTLKVERYTSGLDATTGTVLFNPISDYEEAHPHVPHGINIGIPFVRIGRPEPPTDYLGVPMLAPNYGFGIGVTPLAVPPRPPTSAEIVREVRAEFHDPNPRAIPSPSPDASPALKQIALVVTRTRDYAIAFAGTQLLDGAPADHLTLRPLRDPQRFRLRELWVDPATGAPRKLIEALDFADGPGTTVPWSVRFVQIGGASYIARETALRPMTYRGLRYTHASVSFEDVRPTQTFPRDLSTFVPSVPLLLKEP